MTVTIPQYGHGYIALVSYIKIVVRLGVLLLRPGPGVHRPSDLAQSQWLADCFVLLVLIMIMIVFPQVP